VFIHRRCGCISLGDKQLVDRSDRFCWPGR
jgi:hypothetical protein